MGGPQIKIFEQYEARGLAVKISNFNQNRSNQTKIEKCNHCKKECHTQDRCWFFYPHLKLKKFRGAEKGGDGQNWRRTGKKINPTLFQMKRKSSID